MGSQAIRVLVVDDVRVVRESIRIALAEAGFEVATVGSGGAALAVLRESTFDVLVTDIWMPDGDGLTLIKRIRAEQPTLRVLAMTGGGPRMTIETATTLAEVWGAEQVFVKPFNEAQLVEVLASAPQS